MRIFFLGGEKVKEKRWKRGEYERGEWERAGAGGALEFKAALDELTQSESVEGFLTSKYICRVARVVVVGGPIVDRRRLKGSPPDPGGGWVVLRL